MFNVNLSEAQMRVILQVMSSMQESVTTEFQRAINTAAAAKTPAVATPKPAPKVKEEKKAKS